MTDATGADDPFGVDWSSRDAVCTLNHGGIMKTKLIAAALLTLCALVACGGGGSTGSTGSVIPTPTASASASATPSPGPSAGTQATGQVLSYDNGAPIAGAQVYVGNTLIVGGTPPPTVPSGDVTATTTSTGAFTLTSVPASTVSTSGLQGALPTTSPEYIEIFANGYATLHELVAVPTSGATLGIFKITQPTAQEQAELTAMNSDRASGGDNPVVFDNSLELASRYWANFAVTNNISGGDDTLNGPTAPDYSPGSRWAMYGGFYANGVENIGGTNLPPSGTQCESSLFNEVPAPGPHHDNILIAGNQWVGLGMDQTECVQDLVIP
jgi:hypothetical protein